MTNEEAATNSEPGGSAEAKHFRHAFGEITLVLGGTKCMTMENDSELDGSAARVSPGKTKRLATTIVFSPHSRIMSFGYVGAQIRI